jgi:hypothetical protein
LISQQIQERKNKKFATIKVSLKEDAIAKSHRPTSAVFNYKYPVIGGGDIGEIYVQVNENPYQVWLNASPKLRFNLR